MLKPAAWMIAGAVLATAGVAEAQQTPAPAVAETATSASSSVPWYQRFTTSNSIAEASAEERGDTRLPEPAWTLNQRWGVTLNVREAQRSQRLPEAGRGDQTSVGAYYQFTPRMRLGGELSVENADRPGVAARDEEESRAGVRIESAFRF